MKTNTPPKKKTKWVLRSSPLALKILMVIVILLSITAITALWQVHRAIQSYTQELREDAADITYENQDLQNKINDPNAAQNIIDVAKKELGLVDPDTIIIETAGAAE